MQTVLRIALTHTHNIKNINKYLLDKLKKEKKKKEKKKGKM